MTIIMEVLITVATIILLYYHWNRRHLYKLSYTLPGHFSWPIIGNGMPFLARNADILKIYRDIVGDYRTPSRFWLGQKLLVVIAYPEHIEKVLSSPKIAQKHELYDIIKPVLGDGLISNSGEKYRKHKKLIQPLINPKFVSGVTQIFQKHINIYLNRLEKHVNKGTFDIQSYTHSCCGDIIGESILGIQLDSQCGRNLDYVHASMEMYKVVFGRIMRLWLHPNFIYNLSKRKAEQDRITSVTTNLMRKAIEKSRQRICVRNGYMEQSYVVPIIDQITEIINKDPTAINDVDFIHHLFTLYAASEDTMTIISDMLCVCFGMYPEYQKKAAEEIRSIFGEIPRGVEYDDLPRLQYLEMCIKEVLRLMPIAAAILRETTEEFRLDEILIPKNCGILMPIFEVHRDPKYWKNPEHFCPDHFLPEVVVQRHPFAFLPFSAGPRGCIGKLVAMNGLKMFMANILQRFEIEADGKFPDIELYADITVRSRNGYNIRLKKRLWI